MKENISEKDLRTGDLLICRSNRLLAKMIKAVSKSKYSHTAQVIKVHGQILVVEAQREGVNVINFETWKAKYNYTYLTVRPDDTIVEHYAKFARRALSKTGLKNYDIKALFFDFPLYIYTGTWRGPKTEDEALKEGKWNCSTYTAWIYGFKKWWQFSPQDVFESCKESKHLNFL